MRFWLGVTDNRWYRHVSASASPEVNFWQPSARAPFIGLPEGTLFLFKLKAPNHHIVGGVVSVAPAFFWAFSAFFFFFSISLWRFSNW